MGKFANPGEMRTSVEVLRYKEEPGQGAFKDKIWENIFGPLQSIRCKWTNAHGQEVLAAQSLQYKDVATLKMRYSPNITMDCRIRKVGESPDFEIISMDDIEDRHVQLEIKVRRAIPG